MHTHRTVRTLLCVSVTHTVSPVRATTWADTELSHRLVLSSPNPIRSRCRGASESDLRTHWHIDATTNVGLDGRCCVKAFYGCFQATMCGWWVCEMLDLWRRVRLVRWCASVRNTLGTWTHSLGTFLSFLRTYFQQCSPSFSSATRARASEREQPNTQTDHRLPHTPNESVL